MKPINSTSPLRNYHRLLPIVLVIIGLAGCAETTDQDVPGVDTTTFPTDTAGTMTGTMDASQEDSVEVSLVDYEISMPMTVPAGSITFDVTNEGTEEHNFEIEGQGIEEAFPENLMAGESSTMEVDLQPGTYTVYCPVGDHRSMGMEATLTVEGGQAGMGDM